MDSESIRANPGGFIAPSQVIGRDRLIERLWEKLRHQSVVLTSERRIGKTTILKKMEAETSKGIRARYSDLEGMKTPLEFARKVYYDIEDCLSGVTRTKRRVLGFLEKTKGLNVAGMVELPQLEATDWKTLLTLTLEDLVEHQRQEKFRFIFLWDEFPYMLHNIRREVGPKAAMEVLDVLRSLRNTHGADLRMVLTGSIGLLNVIDTLRREGYTNSPVNDMDLQEVLPISFSDAQGLASDLLLNENIPSGDFPAAAKQIAELTDCIPFYIHKVVDQFKDEEITPSAEPHHIERIVAELLTDSNNPLDLAHFLNRIAYYYTEVEQPLARGLLDILALAENSLNFQELENRLQTKIAVEDSEAIREMLHRLQRDHYIKLEADGTYRFRFTLIRRWWRLHRGDGGR